MANKAKATTTPTPKGLRPGTEAVDDRVMDFTFNIAIKYLAANGDDMKDTLRDAFGRWKDALIDQAKQTTQAARHRAHARVTSMEDLIAETPADDIEGIGIKLALYVYMSGVDPEKADSAVEQVLSAYKDCRRVLGRDLLVEVKGLMPAWQQGA